MKKGEKPTLKQTATLRTINAVVKEIRRLKKVKTVRPLFVDERAEARTLIWVLSLLKNRDPKVELPNRPNLAGVK